MANQIWVNHRDQPAAMSRMARSPSYSRISQTPGFSDHGTPTPSLLRSSPGREGDVMAIDTLDTRTMANNDVKIENDDANVACTTAAFAIHPTKPTKEQTRVLKRQVGATISTQVPFETALSVDDVTELEKYMANITSCLQGVELLVRLRRRRRCAQTKEILSCLIQLENSLKKIGLRDVLDMVLEFGVMGPHGTVGYPLILRGLRIFEAYTFLFRGCCLDVLSSLSKGTCTTHQFGLPFFMVENIEIGVKKLLLRFYRLNNREKLPYALSLEPKRQTGEVLPRAHRFCTVALALQVMSSPGFESLNRCPACGWGDQPSPTDLLGNWSDSIGDWLQLAFMVDPKILLKSHLQRDATTNGGSKYGCIFCDTPEVPVFKDSMELAEHLRSNHSTSQLRPSSGVHSSGMAQSKGIA